MKFDFLLGLSLLSLLTNNNPIDQNNNSKRVYVYFSELSINNSSFNVIGDFYSADGKKYNTEGFMLESNNIAKNKLDSRIWYFDIPKKSQTCIFTVTDKNDATWSKTELSSIFGCVFEYSTSNYSTINDTSGWHNVGLEMEQFADYFISRIDVNSDLYTCGYMSYKSLNDSFFVSITDYESTKETTIMWFDDYLNRNTTFIQKWEYIKTAYIANYKTEDTEIWPYFMGSSLLIIIACATMVYIRKWKKNK